MMKIHKDWNRTFVLQDGYNPEGVHLSDLHNDAIATVSRSPKSKSFYINFKDGEVRVSDHWYMKGDQFQRGNAAGYTREELESYVESGEAIKVGRFYFLDETELLFPAGERKPSIKEAINAIQKAKGE